MFHPEIFNITDLVVFQSPRNGDGLSEGELAEPGSPEDNGNEMGQKVNSSQKEKVQINLRARLSTNRGACVIVLGRIW